MGWLSSFLDVAANVATGGLAGAIDAATSSGGTTTPTPAAAPNEGWLGGIGKLVGTNLAKPQTPVPACCDRFKFDNGFLIDGMSGTIWKFNDATNVLEEIPVSHSPPKKSLIGLLAATRITSIADQYKVEVLATLPEQEREKQAAVFDKEYLEPLRAAALTLRT